MAESTKSQRRFINLRASITLAAAQITVCAVQAITAPLIHYHQKRLAHFQQLIQSSWRAGHQSGLYAGHEVGYQHGLQDGFIAGQHFILNQLQQQPPKFDRWDFD